MKLEVSTYEFQEMVSKAVKGCGNNKFLPITSMLEISVADNCLSVCSTDATNYVKVLKDKFLSEDFYVVVMADQFNKLVSKTTSEKITLELVNNSLTFVGNGKYTLELPLDETGSLIKFAKWGTEEVKNKTTVAKSMISKIVASAKSSIAVFDEKSTMPFLTSYYVGESVVTTDSCKACNVEIKLFDEPMLISVEMFDLIDLAEEEQVEVDILENGKIMLSTASLIIYGATVSGVDKYPTAPVSALFDISTDSVCSISKTAMLSLLNRIELFVKPFDDGKIFMSFGRDGVTVSSNTSDGKETIPYITSEGFSEYACAVNIGMLVDLIKSHQSEAVKIYYGDCKVLKLVEDNTTYILALMQ